MSQDHGRNVVYGREREREMELPVPKYSGSDRSMRSCSLSDVEKRSGSHKNINDNIFGEAYNSSEQSDSPLSGISQVQEGYAAVSASYHQEQSIQRHGFNYKVYNDMPAASFASQHPPEMPKKHPSGTHSAKSSHGPGALKKDSVSGQKVPPSKQLDDYKKKASLLRQELESLKDQRNELRGDGKRSPSPDTKRFLKENTKLQMEIHNKLKTINNVLDMMNGIIGDHTESNEPRSMERKPKQKWSQKFNYVFYDPEMHWCRVCEVFPQTAKDYLNHLHSPEHQTMAAEHEEAPWHGVPGANEGYSSLPTAPTKRTPIRGLQFFVPATAWYCKLCDQFIGDLHCASAHIKSILHSKNYNKFVQQNPHWETDWVSDRQRAFERSRAEILTAADDGACLKQQVKYITHTVTISKDVHTKRPPKTPPLELEDQQRYLNKRKSGRSSTQSSLEDNSGSESEMRIKNRRLKTIETSDNKELENFVSPTPSESRLCDDDRKLLESLKTRIRKQDERQRSPSRDRERTKDMQQRKESESRGRQREVRARSREQRDRHRDRERRDAREWRPTSRDRSDRRNSSRDRRPTSRERDRGPASRERTGGSRDRRGGSRDRRGGSRDRRDGSREQTAESKERLVPQLSPALPLPPPLPMLTAAMPVPMALPPPATFPPLAGISPNAMPPIIMPPPQSLLPGSMLEVSNEFQEALEMLFPTDPAKCTEMLNAMQHQQPSLLGAPPSLPLGFPFGFPPGMFPFDYNAAAARTAPGLLPTPPVPRLPVTLTPGNRRPRSDLPQRKPNRPRQPQTQPDEKGETRASRDQNEELVMLGIDVSDVGAGGV